MSHSPLAKAIDFKQQTVYYPKIRPGYVGWANLFQFGNGDLGTAFNEIRRDADPGYVTPSLEYAESIGVPYSYLNADAGMSPDFVSEFVHMKSSDAGLTWQQTGCCAVHRRHYWYVGFDDGSMVRFFGSTAYENPYADVTCATVEASSDGGNTWQKITSFLDGYYVNMFKFRKLKGDRLIAAGPILPSWGPGQKIVNRHLIAPGQLEKMQAAFFASEDRGRTWTGPHYVFPGIVAWEFDFVELPGTEGDLLFINSTIQTGRPVRQIVRRTTTGYINDPLMSINRGAPQTPDGWGTQEGIVPEAVSITQDGLLIGALRHKTYACSKDLGENWYEIEGAPDSPYQPMCDMLPDGRFINIWHVDGDPAFGEYDMYIGTHTFRVDAGAVPEPMRLDLQRDLSTNQDQYLNQYSATLTSNGKPVAGQTIELYVKPVWHPDQKYNTKDIRDAEDVRTATTDEKGVACFKLTDKDRDPDIHSGYWVMPRFTPPIGSPYAPCEGAQYMAYPTTPVRHQPGHLQVYMQCGNIMITPEIAKQFPDLKEVIARLDPHAPDVVRETWNNIAGSEERAGQILDLLMQHHVIEYGEDSLYRWHRWVVREGHPIIGEVRESYNFDYCI